MRYYESGVEKKPVRRREQRLGGAVLATGSLPLLYGWNGPSGVSERTPALMCRCKHN